VGIPAPGVRELYTERVATVGTLTYMGLAIPGTLTSQAAWQIKLLDETSGLEGTWADGNTNYDNVWDDYASLSYR
jgi:hypothetical protein